MTNAEAIEILSENPVAYPDQDVQSIWDEALDMAISALEKQEGKKPVSATEQRHRRCERGLIEEGWAKVDEKRNKEIVDMFSEFSNDILSVAYVYARCLRDYGVIVSKEWDTITQKREDLNRAYIKGRQDEADKWVERDEREQQRGY